MAASHREDENEEVLNSNEEGWVKVESYKPDGVRVNTPDKPIIIEPNDNAVLDVLKVTLEDGSVLIAQKEDKRVWCCDDDPEIRGLSEGIKHRKLGEFLRITCSPNWHYDEEKREQLGLKDTDAVVFWVWIKEVDPYLNHEPKCCIIL